MNKKLLKSIASITCGLGIATTIPFLTTSCGSSSAKTNILPDKVYKYDPNDSTILTGFTNEFLANPNAYKQYNTMEIPASVTSINESAFCPNNNTTIPDFINKLTFAENSSCLKINRKAFTGAISLKSVSLPEKITMLGDYTFDACSSLTSVDLSNCIDLSSINDGAFASCSELNSIDFSNCTNLSKINSEAFTNCKSITSLDFSKCINLSSISSSAFKKCLSIKDIKIDNDYYHVEQLGPKGKAVISGKKWTTSWNNSSKVIGCLACGDIVIPANVTKIADRAFYHCSSLTSIDFWINLSSIGQYAFYSCTGLTSVTFPSGLTSIGDDAFSYSGLNSVDLSRCTNLTQINNYTFDYCSSLTSVDFSSSLEKIGQSAFRYSALSWVDLSNCIDLSSINDYAFRNCSALSFIIFPSSLTTIQSYVFDGCSNLSSITWNAWQGTTSLDSSLFSDVCPTGGTVTVTDPIDDQHDSDQLLSYLLTNGGLPSTWSKA